MLKTKEESKEILKRVKEFIETKLKLQLNPKSGYFPMDQSADFCGYRTFPTHMLLRTDNKKKMKRKIKILNKQAQQSEEGMNEAIISFNSWAAHVSHCNGYKLVNKMREKLLFGKVESKTIENDLK